MELSTGKKSVKSLRKTKTVQKKLSPRVIKPTKQREKSAPILVSVSSSANTDIVNTRKVVGKKVAGDSAKMFETNTPTLQTLRNGVISSSIISYYKKIFIPAFLIMVLIFSFFPLSSASADFDPSMVNVLVKTNVDGIYGGTKTPADFTIQLVTGSDDSATTTTFPSSLNGVLLNIAPNTPFRITEIPVDDYTTVLASPIASLCVSSGRDAGEAGLFCSFTNTGKSATLHVTTHVVNSPSGTQKSASDFIMHVNSLYASPNDFPGSESGVTVTNITAGSFAVTEAETFGYTKTSTGCDGTIGLNQSQDCTVTYTGANGNDVIVPTSTTATLIVKQIVINDNGGSSTPSSFTENIIANNPSQLTFPGSASGTVVTLNSGGFNVSHNAIPGYSTVSNTCSGLILIGSTKTCTITDDDNAVASQQATLIIKELVINDSGGTATSSNFTVHATGTNISQTDFSGSASGTVVTLDAGTYTITHTPLAHYATTIDATPANTANGSISCTGTISAGQTNTCTFTEYDVSSFPIGYFDLAASGTVDTVSVNPGDTVHYVFYVKNNGPQNGYSITATNTMPSTLTGVSAVTSQGSYNPITGVWTVGSLAVNDSAMITITATVNDGTEGQSIMDSFVTSSTAFDNNLANNNASATITVKPQLVITGEAASSVTDTTITVIWDTIGHVSTSRVLYDIVSNASGTPPNYGYSSSTAEDGTLVTNHSVTISNLIPNTTYYVRAVSHGSPEVTGPEIAVTTTSSGGGGGGAGGGGSAGGGSFGGSTPSVTNPIPQVLGATTDISNTPSLQLSPEGQVLGASTELPRTGSPIWQIILLAVISLSVVLGKQNLKLKLK